MPPSTGVGTARLVDEIQHRMAEQGVPITRDKNEIVYRDLFSKSTGDRRR